MYAATVAAASPPSSPSRSRTRRPELVVRGDVDKEAALHQQFIIHLHRLWDHSGVPQWHRELYTARYCTGHYPLEVLHREAVALAEGTALVQAALRAVEQREEVLKGLTRLRGLHTDADFRRAKGVPRRCLMEHLYALRTTSMTCIEAIAAWRRSVAPLPGQDCPRLGGSLGGPGSPPSSVAGPGARGACWPEGPNGEDYLWQLARDDSVLRQFQGVVELAEETDPLLLLTSSGHPVPVPGKMRPPHVETADLARLEAAKMVLLEEEIALAVFGEHAKLGQMAGATMRLTDSGKGPDTPPPIPGTPSPLARTLPSLMDDMPDLPTSDEVGPNDRSGAAAPLDPLAKSIPPRLLPFLPRRTARNLRRASSVVRRSVIDRQHQEALQPMRNARVSGAGRQSRKTSLAESGKTSRQSPVQGSSSVLAATSLLPGMLYVAKSGPKGESLPLVGRTSSMRPPRPSGLAATAPASTGLVSRDSSSSASIDEEDLDNSNTAQNPSESKVSKVELGRINATFKRFAMDGYVHHDDLFDALKRLGFPMPVRDWVDEAMHQVTVYTALSPAEFVLFISAYEDRVRAACAKEFARYDQDNSGVLDVSEFAVLLRDMGIEPMSHVLEEVISEVDRDKSGMLDFEEFYEVMRLIQEREGFTHTEFDTFMQVFSTFDRDKTGEMDAQELVQVLLYLGYQCTHEDASAVVHEVDFDGSGSMDQHEFIVCMRKIREQEVRALKAAMLQHDVDTNGTIGINELRVMLHSVGYFPDDEVVDETLVDIGVDPVRGEMNLGMLWKFLVVYRQREGLSKADTDEINQAFQKYASSPDLSTAEVSAVHIPKILRYVGYSLSHEEQQRLVNQVDVDGSGALGVFELRKLVRICREQRSRLIQTVFKKYADPHTAMISTKVIPEALHSIGAVTDGRPPPDMPVDEDGQVPLAVSLEVFLRLARKSFAQVEMEVRQNGGYTTEEIEVMKKNFEKFDVDGDGDVKNSELVALVKNVFPDMSTDPRLRPQLMEIIREADADGNGTLSFEDFLRLMRTVCDLRYRNQLNKERQAMYDTGFLPHEVHEFREIFRTRAGGTMHLPLEEFQEMIAPICPLGDKNVSLLNAMWHEAITNYGKEAGVAVEEGDEDRRGEVDFAEFLWLMKKILDTNFGNVLQRTKRHGTLGALGQGVMYTRSGSH